MSECDDAGETEMDQLMRTIPPMDVTMAAALLREAKEVFDELGVVFFLRQGTCLGAVRDGAFIPWDDDIDLGELRLLSPYSPPAPRRTEYRDPPGSAGRYCGRRRAYTLYYWWSVKHLDRYIGELAGRHNLRPYDTLD